MFLKAQKGFTLIELILVAAIITILVTITIATLNPLVQFQKANDARRKSDLSQIQKALEQYYQDKGKYPCSTAVTYRLDPICNTIGKVFDGKNNWSPYMNVLPADPDTKRRYKYFSPDGQTYYLYASLDRADKDSSSCDQGNECASISDKGQAIQCQPYPYTGAKITCNYGVSSPNTSP